MAEIICYADSCKYWQEGNHCSCAEIEISEDNECDSYVYYKESEEWQTPFWKVMYVDKDKNKAVRVKYFGKEIEFEGRKFFIEFKNSYTAVTDKETGLYCGELRKLSSPERIKKIKEVSKNYPPVMSLPIARIDRRTGEITPVKESEEEK